MSLLLTFFILILSFSTIQKVKFDQVTSAIRRQLGAMPRYNSVLKYRSTRTDKGSADTDQITDALNEFKAAISSLQLQDQVKVMMTDQGVRFIIYDPLLFASGRAELEPAAGRPLELVSSVIKKMPPCDVMVEGHTDNIPISTVRYRSNWSLSSARALSVVEHFTERNGLPPERLGATGYGEYRPAAVNDNPAGRAKNRRVEIHVYMKSSLGETPAFLRDKPVTPQD
jgi:chemotaxis protein MotB